jgi:hypothetical protein
MKEGKIYRNIETGELFILIEYTPYFSRGIILYNPIKRKHTGKVEFVTIGHNNFEEFKGTLLITCI